MSDWLRVDRWLELEPLLDDALERDPEARASLVRETTRTDPALGAMLSKVLDGVIRVDEFPLLDSSASAVFSSLLEDDAEDSLRALQDALSDRYEIVRELGQGGMATVYLANDLREKRQVALKVLLPDLSQSLGAERFAREIRLVATLAHPNIVGILDSGNADGHLWFAMPFIEGESLRERVKRVGQLPFDDALTIMQQAASALGYAHERGIIHRDVKPDNIMLSGNAVFVADFGIARAMEASGEALTRTGMSVGTPAYMAPEQAAGEKQLDARVDVYALGSVLYEMLAGTTAFTGPSAQAIIVRAMTSDPQPIHPIRSAVPPALDAVILKAMSRTPTDRYTSMAVFSDAVATAAVSQAAAERLPAKRSRSKAVRVAIGVAATIGAITVGGLVVQYARATPPRLAVLPFENRSRDTSDAYLADGFTEEIGNRIARVSQLSVVSNTAVRRIERADAMSISEIGKVLGATYLMSGSVQRVGSRLRATVELSRASSGEQVWSQTYDRAESELPLLMHDITVATATGMLGTLSAATEARLIAPTENSGAYDRYLRGSVTRFSEDAIGLQQAIASFEGALALDPRFAAAQGRLAAVYARSVFWSVTLPGMSTDTVVARAAVAASRALALDSASAEAWAGRGTVLFFGNQPNYASAAAALGRAAALDSTNAGVHWMRGQILRRLGDFPAAEAATRAAINADPQFAQAFNQLANIAYTDRRLEQAILYSDSAIGLRADLWQYWEIRSRIYLAMRNLVQARQAGERAVSLSPASQHDYAVLVLAQVQAMEGDTASAREALEPIIALVPPEGPLTPRSYQTAAALISVGRTEEGLRLLERIQPRGAWLWSYLIQPGFDAVRTTPRFAQLVNESRPPGVRKTGRN